LNWLSESSSLSGSLRSDVDVVDLFPNCNCRVQMGIWLRDRDSHNWFSLFSNHRNRSGLNWMRTPS